MRTWALVPLNSVGQAKSRLANCLSEYQRAGLHQRLASLTLNTLAACPTIDKVIAITSCPVMAALAEESAAQVLIQPQACGTNQAYLWAIKQLPASVDRLLLIASDLPLIERSAIDSLINNAIAELVLVADRHNLGTNALLAKNPLPIMPAFGPSSLGQHLQRATDADITAQLFNDPRLSLDLDTDNDLLALPCEIRSQLLDIAETA